MYIPGGYHNGGHHSLVNPASGYSLGHSVTNLSSNPAPSYVQHQQQRARSTTPTGGNRTLLDSSMDPNPPRMLYAELQFPVTSNYGSMKKKGQRHSNTSSSGNTNNTSSSTVLSSAGEPSPPSSEDSHHLQQQQQQQANMSLENVHRYVPDFVAVSQRKTAV